MLIFPPQACLSNECNEMKYDERSSAHGVSLAWMATGLNFSSCRLNRSERKKQRERGERMRNEREKTAILPDIWWLLLQLACTLTYSNCLYFYTHSISVSKHTDGVLHLDQGQDSHGLAISAMQGSEYSTMSSWPIPEIGNLYVWIKPTHMHIRKQPNMWIVHRWGCVISFHSFEGVPYMMHYNQHFLWIWFRLASIVLIRDWDAHTPDLESW